jgi:hypothetical protein
MLQGSKRMRYVIAGAILVGISANSIAAPLVLYPIQTGAETVRFRQGVPTLDLETPTGAIEITPLPFDHGHVTFGLGIYNKATQPANFGIENVAANVDGQPVSVLAVDELEKRAKSRAMWSQIGVAVLAGAAAGAMANAHTTNTYHGYMRTPRGSYSWATSYRDNSVGVLGATAAVAGGAAGINGIQNRLDFTLANLANEIVQTTTVDGNGSYGGRIVLEKTPTAKLPYDVHVTINWNGVQYPFVFRVTKQGVAVPQPYTAGPIAYAPQAPARGSVGSQQVASSAAPAVPVAPVEQLSPYELGKRQAQSALAVSGARQN